MDQDDILPFQWVRSAVKCSDAVAYILQPKPATGFLISDWLLMTNAHVLPSATIAARSHIRFRYDDRGNGLIRYEELECDPARFFLVDKGLDYAVVALRALKDGKAPGRRYGFIVLDGREGKALVGHPLNIIQHPNGRTKSVAFRDNRLLALEAGGQTLTYKTDTEPGSSGSPVFNDAWELIALHRESVQREDAMGIQIDKRGEPVNEHTPEHLRHWVANRGTRASAIVSSLRERIATLNEESRQLISACLMS